MRIRRYKVVRALQLLSGSLSRTGFGRSLRRQRFRRRLRNSYYGAGEYETLRRSGTSRNDEPDDSRQEMRSLEVPEAWDEEYLAGLPKGRASSRRILWSLLAFYFVVAASVLSFVAWRRDMVVPAMGRLGDGIVRGAATLEDNLELEPSLTRHLLEGAIPGLRRPEPKVTKELVLSAMSRAVKRTLPDLTGVDLRSPSSIIDSQIASLNAAGIPRTKVKKAEGANGAAKKRDLPVYGAGVPKVRVSRAQSASDPADGAGEREKDAEPDGKLQNPDDENQTANGAASGEDGTREEDAGQKKTDLHPAAGKPETDLSAPSVDTGSKTIFGSEPLVAIYHSHTSETYAGENGHYIWESAKPDKDSGDYVWGTAKGVVTVGTELAVTLKRKYGISAVHSKKVHDYPVFRDAYKNALGTIESILKTSPSIEMVFDIHRDGLAETDSTCTINGKKAARVFIVVTSDKFGLPHPNWRQNYAFALALNSRINQLYPGLSRGVNLRDDSRWNQHVHERAVILEVGSNKNTTEQALETARLLADPIADLLREIRSS